LLQRYNALPGFGLSFGLSVLFISLVVLLPLCALLLTAAALDWRDYWAAISDPRVVASYRVTLGTAFTASLLNAVIGLWLAWILVRYEFPGRRLIDALVDLPFALPTAVAGLTLSAIFATNGWVGQWLAPFGVRISYSWAGIVVAMVFTSLPFVVRAVQPVLEDVGSECEEAAQVLGATPWQIFRRVIFPAIAPALIIGTALSFIRSLGEFGAIIFIAGNMPYQTEVTSLMIFVRLQEYNQPAAAAIASVVLFASLILLGLIQWLQSHWLRRGEVR
jgi:sulfate transport system permease protein